MIKLYIYIYILWLVGGLATRLKHTKTNWDPHPKDEHEK